MTIAFDAILEIYRRLGATNEDATYLIDSGISHTSVMDCAALTQADDFWNKGTLLILTNADSAGAVPANESRAISDFSAADDRVTVAPAFSAAMAASDTFAITTDEYPRHVILRAINAALQWYGDIPTNDSATLDTAASTLEYSLPAAAVHDLRQVYVAASTTAPLTFRRLPYWHVDRGNGKLVFHVQPPYVRDIRLVYMAPHATISTDSATINPALYLPALYEYTMAQCYLWKVQKVGYDDKKWIDFYNQALQLAEKYKSEHPIRSESKDVTLWYAESKNGGLTIADPS